MPRGLQQAGARRRGRPTLLANTPTAELRRELERRQSMLQDILRQRDALSAELQELQSIFGGSLPLENRRSGPGRPPGSGKRRGRPPGSAGGKRGGRSGNATNLVTALQNTLAGKTMSVAEMTEEVQKNGYKTKSGNFRTIVNQALIANPDVFKKIARGQYTAR